MVGQIPWGLHVFDRIKIIGLLLNRRILVNHQIVFFQAYFLNFQITDSNVFMDVKKKNVKYTNDIDQKATSNLYFSDKRS